MAEHKTGKKNPMLFYIDHAGGTSYETVVCITVQTSELTSNITETFTACGRDVEPGTQSATYTIDCQARFDPATGRTSYAEIAASCKAQTVVGYKKSVATPATGDVVETGTGYITSVSQNNVYDGVDTFSFTVTPIDLPTYTVTP